MSTIPTDISIKSSLFKVLRLIAVLFLFMIAGVFLMVNPSPVASSMSFESQSSEWAVQAVGLCAVLFFGGGLLIVGLLLLRSGSMQLDLDDHGIHDQTSLSSLGFIEWRDLLAVEEINLSGAQRAILLKVSNPEAYVDKATGKWSKYIVNRNMKAYGTPLVIHASFLKISSTQLYSLLKAELNKHRHFITE